MKKEITDKLAEIQAKQDMLRNNGYKIKSDGV